MSKKVILHKALIKQNTKPYGFIQINRERAWFSYFSITKILMPFPLLILKPNRKRRFNLMAVRAQRKEIFVSIFPKLMACNVFQVMNLGSLIAATLADIAITE